MGGYPLEDHRQIHRILGISRLVSFDLDETTVRRQLFNRPVASCRCLLRSSEEVVEGLEQVLRDGEADGAAGVIVWLDYTAPKELGSQIREFHTLLDSLTPGDVVRVTVNANPGGLGEKKNADGSPLSASELRKFRFETLSSRISEYLPSNAVPENVARASYPALLASSFGHAASKAFPSYGDDLLVPLSAVSYTDGQQMLSITAMVMSRDSRDRIISNLSLSSWPFFSASWSAVHNLRVPNMTSRERLYFEQRMAKANVQSLSSELEFLLDGFDSMEDLIDEYGKFYRFYPSLAPVDL